MRGRVVFYTTDEPVHGAIVLIVGTGRSATTNDNGEFEVRGLWPGRYRVVAQRSASIEVPLARRRPSRPARVELMFRVQLQAIHEEVNVAGSATGTATNFEAFNSIQSLGLHSNRRPFQSVGQPWHDCGPGLGRPHRGGPRASDVALWQQCGRWGRSYGRIANLVTAGVAKRQTASEYLARLTEIGVLTSVQVGRQKLFVHQALLTLLASDAHDVTAHKRPA